MATKIGWQVLRGLEGLEAPVPTPYVVTVVKPTGTASTAATATTAAPTTTMASATATVAATAAIAATPTLARPTPTAVAALSPRIVIATPSPTARPAVAKGTLSLWVDGWATVEIDGKQLSQTAPFVGVQVAAGKHTLTYYNQWARRETTITIKPGAETKLTLDLKN